MTRNLYWLSETEWAAIQPHLPTERRGARRVDDRRVVSGILHMLKTGACRRDCPPEYGPKTTIRNRCDRWSRQGVWEGFPCPVRLFRGGWHDQRRQHVDQGAPFGFRRKRGEFDRRSGDHAADGRPRIMP